MNNQASTRRTGDSNHGIQLRRRVRTGKRMIKDNDSTITTSRGLLHTVTTADDNPEAAGTNSTISNSNNAIGNIPNWGIALLFGGCVLLFLAWALLLASRRKRDEEQERAADEAMRHRQEEEEARRRYHHAVKNKKKLSHKERKRLLLQYFQYTKHEMKVTSDNFIPCSKWKEEKDSKDKEHNTVFWGTIDEEDKGEGSVDETTKEDCGVVRLDKTTEQQVEDPEGTHKQHRPHIILEEETRTEGDESAQDVVSCTTCQQQTNTNHRQQHRQPAQFVADACAICMESYHVGDTLVYSCTAACPHVFHKTCFVDYLSTYKGEGTPCPMCRQAYDCDGETAFCRRSCHGRDSSSSRGGGGAEESTNSSSPGIPVVEEDVEAPPVMIIDDSADATARTASSDGA